MLKDYRVYARKVPLDDGTYTMDHTAAVYLLDAKGRFTGTRRLPGGPGHGARQAEAAGRERRLVATLWRRAMSVMSRAAKVALSIAGLRRGRRRRGALGALRRPRLFRHARGVLRRLLPLTGLPVSRGHRPHLRHDQSQSRWQVGRRPSPRPRAGRARPGADAARARDAILRGHVRVDGERCDEPALSVTPTPTIAIDDPACAMSRAAR